MKQRFIISNWVLWREATPSLCVASFICINVSSSSLLLSQNALVQTPASLTVITVLPPLTLLFLPPSSTVGLFARPPSHVSSQSHESALPLSPSRAYLDQTCTSHSSETSGLSEAAGHLPTSPNSLVVKEEPCDMDTVLIKWEMSEERFGEHQGSADSPCQEEGSPALKSNVSCFYFLCCHLKG